MTEKVYGWNDAIEDVPREEIKVLPEGEVSFRVVSLTRKQWGEQVRVVGGRPYAEVGLSLIDANGDEGYAKVNLTLMPRFAWRIREFGVSIGDQVLNGQPYQINWGALVGREGRCRIKVREWQDKEGNKRQGNDVVSFLEPRNLFADEGGAMPF